MNANSPPMSTLIGSQFAAPETERNGARRSPWGGWFRKKPAPDTQPGTLVDRKDSLDLHGEFEELVSDCLSRFGFTSQALKLEAVCLGRAKEREVYVVLLTVTNDDANAALQLTYIAPMIEKRVADLVRTRWIGDYSFFAGVWTHWPSELRLPAEVKQLLHSARQLSRAGQSQPTMAAAG